MFEQIWTESQGLRDLQFPARLSVHHLPNRYRSPTWFEAEMMIFIVWKRWTNCFMCAKHVKNSWLYCWDRERSNCCLETLQVFRQRGSWHEDSIGEPLWFGATCVQNVQLGRCWRIEWNLVKPSETYSHVLRNSWLWFNLDRTLSMLVQWTRLKYWKPWRDLQKCGLCPEMLHPKSHPFTVWWP